GRRGAAAVTSIDNRDVSDREGVGRILGCLLEQHRLARLAVVELVRRCPLRAQADEQARPATGGLELLPGLLLQVAGKDLAEREARYDERHQGHAGEGQHEPDLEPSKEALHLTPR